MMTTVAADIRHFTSQLISDQHTAVLCALVAVAAVTIWRCWAAYKSKYSYYQAPSPSVRPPWWLLGHVEIVERVTDRHQLYKEWHEQYGPFVRIRIAYRSMLLVADPAAAASILTKGPDYVARKPPEYTAFDVAHGLHGYSGMLTHQDEGTWRAVRRAITPAFTLTEVKKRYPVMLRCLSEMITNMDKVLTDKHSDHSKAAQHSDTPVTPAAYDATSHSKPISATQDGHHTSSSVQTMTANSNHSDGNDTDSSPAAPSSAAFNIEHHMLVAANQMMSRGFLQLPEGFLSPEQLAHDVGFVMETASRFICEPWRWFAHLYLPFMTQEGRRLWSARRRLAATAERIHDLLQQRYNNSPPTDTDNSLAACLMRVTDKAGNKPKRGALVAEICDALTASETVPSTVMWTMYNIVMRPGLQQRLQQELTAAGITASGHNSLLLQATADLNSVPCSKCCSDGLAATATSSTSGDKHSSKVQTGSVVADTAYTRDQSTTEQSRTGAGVTDKLSTTTATKLAPSAAAAAPADIHQRTAAAGSSECSIEDLAKLLQQRQQQLIDQISAAGPELFRQLPLLQACLFEAMRMFPAGAPGAPRLTEGPTQVGPYLVPPGVMVFPNIFAIMNYSSNWEQPDKFLPERWSEPHADKDPSTGATKFVPFSLGPKACAGQNLALLQCKAALAVLLAAYEWSLAPSMGGGDGVAARTYLGVTIKVKDGLWFTGKPRM